MSADGSAPGWAVLCDLVPRVVHARDDGHLCANPRATCVACKNTGKARDPFTGKVGDCMWCRARADSLRVLGPHPCGATRCICSKGGCDHLGGLSDAHKAALAAGSANAKPDPTPTPEPTR